MSHMTSNASKSEIDRLHLRVSEYEETASVFEDSEGRIVLRCDVRAGGSGEAHFGEFATSDFSYMERLIEKFVEGYRPTWIEGRYCFGVPTNTIGALIDRTSDQG